MLRDVHRLVDERPRRGRAVRLVADEVHRGRVGRHGRDRDDQVAERVVRLEPAARADADQPLAAELDQLLEDDRRAGAAHPRSLHRDRLALERAGVAEQAALARSAARRRRGRSRRCTSPGAGRRGGGRPRRSRRARRGCGSAWRADSTKDSAYGEELVEPAGRAGARVLLARARSSACSSRTSRAAGSGGSSASRGGGGELDALCHVGANLVPSGEGCGAFADAARRSRSRMIIGEERAVGELWAAAARADAGAARGPAGPARVRDLRAAARRATPGCAPATHADLDAAPAGVRGRARGGARRRPARARRGRLPLARRASSDRGRPLVALARGRRDPLQGRGLGLDADGRAAPAGLGRPEARAGAATRAAACATSAGCCSRRRRS